MAQIIVAQRGLNPSIKADEIQLGKISYHVEALQDEEIIGVDMKYLNTIVRTLGAPAEYKAGIYLHKKLGDKVKKGDILYTLYSESETKMDRAKEMLALQDFYIMQQV
jgi:AMP phosphorylase